MASSKMPTARSLTEFHHFPKLPIEVRWMIWTLAFPRRVIDIFAHKIKTWTDNDLDCIPERLDIVINPDLRHPELGHRIHMERIFARVNPTPISAVNREARALLPRGYTHHISTDLALPHDYTRCKHPELPVNPLQEIFLADESNASNFTKINFGRDVISFRAHDSQRSKYGNLDVGNNLEVFLGWTSREVLRSVRHLAIDYDDQCFWLEAGLDKWIEPLLHFPNLETLYVVFDFLDSQDQRLAWEIGDWSWFIDHLAKSNVDWKRPEIKIIKNRKALCVEVESSG